MIEQRVKLSDRKFRKLPSTPKDNSTTMVNNTKREIQNNKDRTPRHNFGDSCSATQSEEEERPENVQIFLNQVSNLIAKKNSSKTAVPTSKSQNNDSEYVKKRDEIGKNQQKEFLGTAKSPKVSKRNKTQSETSPLSVENKSKTVFRSEEADLEEPTTKRVERKRKRPSEIPLRKKRMDKTREPKAVSTLLQKPVKEVESITSFDFYLNKKPFSPIDEVSICSELQITINAISSSEKLNSDTEATRIESSQENLFSIKLERCSKNPNIPTNIESLYAELSDEKSSTGKKVKILDLEKVKASSFTVLQTSSVVLDRLESLHKQNVLAKEKKSVVSCKKIKTLTPKQYHNTIKRRSSVKSIGSRKRNKSCVKIKLKKSRKEMGEDVSPKKFAQPKMNSDQNSLAAKKIKNEDAGECKTENVTKKVTKEEDINATRPKQKPRNKLVLQKAKKVDSKIPTPQRHLKHVEDLEKLKVTPTKTKTETVSVSIKPKLANPTISALLSKKPDTKLKDDDENSYKTVVLSERRSNSPKSNELEKRNKKPERKLKETEGPKVKNFPLIVKGTALKFDKVEVPEKKKESKTKVKLKIDLNLQHANEEITRASRSCDLLFKNDSKQPKEPKENAKTSHVSPDSVVEAKIPEPLPAGPDLSFHDPSKSCSVLKQKFLNKVSGLKAKDIRNNISLNAGDRPAHSLSSIFNPNVPFPTKPKPETKPRTTLTKSCNKDEKREIFEENSLKLRRRSSEPISFSGYILRRTDFPTFKSHEPSVSSMTSSLRHLNTDDIEDFFFWEPEPEKMTSCWEMSLYQYKKPWSVLSCSVFKDNWLSNTPSLILENVRNGRNYSTRPIGKKQAERVPCAKENSFDVEPSITQKNIDIINWLSALNFPTSNSNAAEVITEGNFTLQSGVDSQNLNKAQVTQKRRKVLKNLKFLESASKLLTEDSSVRTYIIQDLNIDDNLHKPRDLIGYLDSKYHRQNIPMDPLLASRSPEKKTFLDERSIFVPKRPKKYEFETIKQGRMDAMISSNFHEQYNESMPRSSKAFKFGRFLSRKKTFLCSEHKFWEYLFIFSLLLVIAYYFSNSSTGSCLIYA